jgi:hypothetical protein
MVETLQHFQVIALGTGAGALGSLYGFFNRLRRDLLVAGTPAVRIRSAAQGYVKVTGRAVPAGPAPTAAPLSSRPCVWWDYQIAREERDSKGRSSWHTIENATSVELFVLEDGDAQCLVGPVKAEVTPTVHNVWYGPEPRPAGPPPAVNVLLVGGPYRYTERLLGIGAQVSVMGELRSRSETGDLSAATASKLHEWKQDQQSLLARFDLDHDGRLNAAEWEAARAAAARECQTQTLQSAIERESVISEPTNGEPFLIAPMSPESLERREKRYVWFYLVLGIVCVTVCAWALYHARLLGAAPR